MALVDIGCLEAAVKRVDQDGGTMSSSEVKRLLDVGKLEAAEKLARRSVEENPTSGGAYATLAAVQFRRGRLPDSEATLREAMRLGPIGPSALRLHGKILCAQHRWEDAIPILRRAYSTQQAPASLHNLAIALYMAGRYAEAAEAYKKLLPMEKSGGKSADACTARIALTQELAGREPYRLSGARGGAVPFLSDYELPTIEAGIQGKPARLLIDTGGSELLLRETFAKEAGIKRLGDGASFQASFAGGTSGDLSYAVARGVQIGSLRLQDVPAVISQDNQAHGEGPCGVIGVQILRRFRSCFDYPNERLILGPADIPFTPPAGAVGVPFFTIFDHFTVAYGCLENGSEEAVFVDSGGTFGLAVTDRRFRRTYGGRVKGRHRTGRSAVAEIEFKEFDIKRFSLGSIVTIDLDGVLGVFGSETGERLGFAIELMASHNFLSRYVVTWDYELSRLWFSEAPASSKR